MNLIKHIKNAILSVGIITFQILSPQTKPKESKKVEGSEENDDVPEDYKQAFLAAAIEYNPSTKAILHQYYKMYDDKYGEKNEKTMYVSGVVGKRIPLSTIRRTYFAKLKNAKTVKRT